MTILISQTPFRISFLGGGTDYPDYFRRHGGATLAASINRYTIITVQPLTQFAEDRVRVHYSRVESVQRLDEIQHPSARECLRFMGIDGGVEIHYVSDLPARTGLGSSSSATVGLLQALHAYKGEMVSREQIATEAVHVEQNLIKERVGSQDQYACALGGLQHLEFRKDGTVRPHPVTLSSERLNALESRLMLFYTGIQRQAHEVLDEQIQKTQAGTVQQELGGLKALAEQGLQALAGNQDLREFGALLHDGWMLKKKLSSKISSTWIDGAYDRARKAGAVGGKLLGAGGGGFLLLFVEPELRSQVRSALSDLREAEFKFDNTGTQVIFYRP